MSEDAPQVEARVGEIRERIASAARRSGRAPNDVRLVAVTKRQPLERIAAGVAAGLTILGENYVQETRDKKSDLASLLPPDRGADLEWHMIGHLQRNKARLAIELFDTVETLDRESLAVELDRRAGAAGRQIEVLVQVNLSGESQKAGLAAGALPELLRACAPLPHLTVTGLMTIPAPSPDPETTRPVFAQLRGLRDTLCGRDGGEALRELSMGMSADFEVAVEEGATLVRVGTALFGERQS